MIYEKEMDLIMMQDSQAIIGQADRMKKTTGEGA
jgi:hypothetical protein